MSFLDTKYKRKSAVYTSIIGILILVILFTFGLTYFDPPIEYGIAVNFGTSDVGSGEVQPTEALRPSNANEEPIEEVIEQPQEIVEPSVSEPEAAEEVMTQDNAEALAIKKAEEERKLKEAREREERERRAEEERQRLEAERLKREQEEREQAAKRKNLDALMGGFSDQDGRADGGEGNDNKAGDKGSETGDPNASGYYGVGGGGSGGNYQLGNRTALNRPKPEYDCNEEGRVVVTISVDQNGKVIDAQPGAKGTTNSASCLLNRAKEAALRTTFNPDNKAPVKQVGKIIYNFSLSE